MNEVQLKGKKALQASRVIGNLSTAEKNEGLQRIAEQLLRNREMILEENKKDLQAGKENGLSQAILDRIMLNKQRIQDMADAISLLIDLKDPIGEVIEEISKDNGLKIMNKRVPIGVIGMVYEARPNVTIDAATLSLKTGNAVILRGSSSAVFSNMALMQTIHEALEKSSIPVDAVQLLEDTSRATAKELFQLNEYLDVLIPRGGANLIKTVAKEATVPVITTGAGVCHVYIDEFAEKKMAEEIVLNSKLQRPSVCNAVETILIDQTWYKKHGSELLQKLVDNGVTIYADERARATFPSAKKAREEDWATEYLGLFVSVKITASLDEAIQHINHYGTLHSEAIVTDETKHAEMFLSQVDAAAVYHNAATRFTDGFEFGYGAEIGISTQKLHARGPMGLKALTSNKYVIYGEGQIRR